MNKSVIYKYSDKELVQIFKSQYPGEYPPTMEMIDKDFKEGFSLFTSSRLKRRFGTYRNFIGLCSYAEFVPHGLAKKGRAKDGHSLDSKAEIMIDDKMYELGIGHCPHVKYSNFVPTKRSWICDWRLEDGTVIEYLGMYQSKRVKYSWKYLQNVKAKVAVLVENGIKYKLIFPSNLHKLDLIFTDAFVPMYPDIWDDVQPKEYVKSDVHSKLMIVRNKKWAEEQKPIVEKRRRENKERYEKLIEEYVGLIGHENVSFSKLCQYYGISYDAFLNSDVDKKELARKYGGFKYMKI